MRASTELSSVDAEACAKVLGELERLQNAVQTDTFQGDATTLRAIVECPFPLAFLDILQTIDAFADKPLLEAVAACVAIENRIAEGQPATTDSGGLSQGKMELLADLKAQEFKGFESRMQQRQSEHEEMCKRERLAAEQHVCDLNAAEKSLREMRAEEGRIRMELAQVHAEAAKQRSLLEKIVQERGKSAEGGSHSDGRDGALIAARNAAWKGKEVSLGMTELLRARGGADRAIECVTAAGHHFSFVCHVAQFVRETRVALTAQCDNVLLAALNEEGRVLQETRSSSQKLLAKLKEVTDGKVGAGKDNAGSLQEKYMKFIAGQFKAINSRLVRSRFAAASVLSSLQNEPGSMSSGSATLLDLASRMVKAVDEQRAVLLSHIQDELKPLDILHQPKEIDSNSKASAGIFWSAHEEQTHNATNSSTVEIRRLQDLEGDSRMQGRVALRQCTDKPDPAIIELAQALCHPLPAGLALSGSLSCQCAALTSLCTGELRSATCWLPDPSADDSKDHKAGTAASTTALLLTVALMRARADWFWLRKIAVIDCAAVFGDIGLCPHPAIMGDPDLLVVTPAVGLSQSFEVTFEDAARKVADFQPQLLVICAGRAPLQAGGMDDAWIGKWAAGLSAQCCKGRTLVLSNSSKRISTFLSGTLEH